MKFLIIFTAWFLQWRFPEKKRRAPKRVFVSYLGLWKRVPIFLRLNSLLQYSLVVVIPSLLLAYGFYLMDAKLWGLGNYFLESFMLFFVLMHADTRQHVHHYREAILASDIIKAYECARQHLSLPNSVMANPSVMNEQVIRALLYRWFEYFFLILFWYLLLDMAGLFLAWFTVMYSKIAKNNRIALRALYFIEYIPLRLLALTYGLAGNFMAIWPEWKKCLWKPCAHKELLFSCANLALKHNEIQRHWHDAVQDSQAAVQDLDEWLRLQGRVVSIWLVVIAIATLSGWLI